jgi:diguanylate cyclase (GGDEF)-like protein/PAS domain S-box-containing protein
MEKTNFTIDYKAAFDSLNTGVYFVDKNRVITYWNAAAEKITGYPAKDVIGRHCWDNTVVHLDMKGRNLCNDQDCPVLKAIQDKRLVQEEVYIKHAEGFRIPVDSNISCITDEKGVINGAVEIFTDNLAKVEAFQKFEKLKQLVFIDSLTGVGNRRYTEIKVNVKLQKLSKYAWEKDFGLLFVDVDDFKKINDVHGHEAGDRALRMVARTLISNIREHDFIGRWGGEEFIAVISEVDKKALFVIAEKLRSLIQEAEITYGDKKIKLTVSIGATLARRNESIGDLVNRADGLMYYSKHLEKNCVTIG